MSAYLFRRLLLLPITLFFVVFVNFIIINMAPGEPTTISDISPESGMRQQMAAGQAGEDRYLQFREFYGLTLPILLNTWPWTSEEQVEKDIKRYVKWKENPNRKGAMSVKEADALRLFLSDRARFTMPQLLAIAENREEPVSIRRMAVHFFIRGATRQGFVGPNLTPQQKEWNEMITRNHLYLDNLRWKESDPSAKGVTKVHALREWFKKYKKPYQLKMTNKEKIEALFFDTRFYRYMSRVFRLDFGTLRNDPNKTVIGEVTSRFKYSLTLSIIPMLLTFALCQFFGFMMAYQQNRWPDYSLNVTFLILYAIPIFVVAPFLIEKVALNHTFPFTNIPIPISGFTSPENIYSQQTSYERLFDTVLHIFLPIVAITYGTLAAQTRLSRTAVLEVLRQDYVRTAYAKGLAPTTILFTHVSRNAAITIITSLAGSLGIILGGSLIVETLFDINGFGKFFYDAVLNRDYNVILFSALAGSFLTLMGYLVADIAYVVLDPRVTFD